jgi:hypothetical protein
MFASLLKLFEKMPEHFLNEEFMNVPRSERNKGCLKMQMCKKILILLK